MNTKQLLAVIASTIAGYLAGFLIFGLAMDGYFKSHLIEYEGLHKEMPDMVTLILGHVFWSAMTVYVLVKMGINSAAKGFVTMLIISALATMGYDTISFSMSNMWDSAFVIPITSIANGVWGGVMGAAAAAVLGRGSKS